LLLLCEPLEPFEAELEEPELDAEFEPEFEPCPCEASAGETATADVRTVRKMAAKRETLVMK
jgi:hypothetical protein